MILLLLAACSNDYEIKAPEAPDELSLTLTSPSYGVFLGDGGIEVAGMVTPANAFVQVNGTAVYPDETGAFATVLAFDDRAVVVDVTAIAYDQRVREIVPVFDGTDPRSSDPGAIGGLLTPTGLDALEPTVADLVDSLGWEDLILSALPAIDTDYVDLTPLSVTSTGTTADLAPGFDSVELSVTLHDVTLLTDVTILDAYTFELGISLGEVGFGAHATPWIDADGMLGLSLADAIVEMGDVGLSVEGWEIPEWITDLLLDPVADLVASLGEGLGDLLLDQVGDLPLGGPFAFDLDLLGTRLAAQLVDVDASGDGVSLGATIGYGEDAADEMPDVATLGATTPSGLPYQLGAAVHEGMFNVLLDETLAGFLDIDLTLEGEYGELLGSGIAALDGGNEIPDEANGFCISLHVGDARVIRMVPGTGEPLARAYLPDVQVDIATVIDGDCEDWLSASVFAVIDLTLDGTEVRADFDVRDVAVLEYGAERYDLQGVEDQLGAVVESLAGLLGGQLSFDLGDALGGLGGFGISPEVVAIEPLDDDGLYGVYLDVFGTDL
ncbi:MAG: hypothetical protein Q8P41_31990 [Pseudomonadota bacterium]|nr:hypothetical protein [Pseudomonadota bacterium]